jgi:hypothetical protein
MKLITKLSLVAAAIAALGTSAAFGDDQQLQNRLATQRAQDSQRIRPTTTTVAVYAGQGGLGASAPLDQRAETHFELRFNAHGRTFGAYVPAQ